tara:strand:+ start:1081 stop:2103 length:1023 start_codon:yes stop_codon:yes gene_type:complete
MAQATNYFPTQAIQMWYQQEAQVGVQPDENDLLQAQLVSFTLPEASVPIETSAQRAGKFTMQSNQVKHSQGTKLWTFETVLRGTPKSLDLAFSGVMEDYAVNYVLNNTYEFPTDNYNVSATSGGTVAGTFEIRFTGVGQHATNNNMEINGCVATSVTLTQDIGAEAGEMVCTIQWATGFQPIYTATAVTGGSPDYDVDVPVNIRQLSESNTTVDTKELVLKSWSLSINRTIERIHYADNTDASYKPFGYAMTGAFEVSGELSVIRNTDISVIANHFYDSTPVAINIQADTANDLTITLPICYINEPTIDTGQSILHQVIPFVVYASDSSSETAMVTVNCQ